MCRECSLKLALLRMLLRSWAGKQIRDQLAWARRLAELIAALQNVEPFGAMRSVGATTAELPIVVAVMTIRAQQAHSHAAPLSGAIQVEHVSA